MIALMGIQEPAKPKAPQDGRKAAYFARNEAALLKATQEVLADIGWAAKIADVSKAADVAASTIYMHFDNKDALFEAAVVAGMQEWENWALAQLEGVSDPFESLVTPMRIFVRIGETHELFGRIVAKNLSHLSVRLPVIAAGLLSHVRELATAGFLKIDNVDKRVSNLSAVLVNTLQRQLTVPGLKIADADLAIQIALPMLGISEAEAARLIALPLTLTKPAAKVE
jgi:AcrR family transcriptional regulator